MSGAMECDSPILGRYNRRICDSSILANYNRRISLVAANSPIGRITWRGRRSNPLIFGRKEDGWTESKFVWIGVEKKSQGLRDVGAGPSNAKRIITASSGRLCLLQEASQCWVVFCIVVMLERQLSCRYIIVFELVGVKIIVVGDRKNNGK